MIKKECEDNIIRDVKNLFRVKKEVVPTKDIINLFRLKKENKNEPKTEQLGTLGNFLSRKKSLLISWLEKKFVLESRFFKFSLNFLW